MKKSINGIIMLIILLLCSGCCNKHMIIPTVTLFEDYVDCNEDYIVAIREGDEAPVVDVIQEGKVISRLRCAEYDIEPEMVAVGQKGYYLLDDSSEGILFIVNFDSEIVAEKKIPTEIRNISCRDGYVFLGQFLERYKDGFNADYFFSEDDSAGGIQIITQENVRILTGVTFYKSAVGFSTEPSLEKFTRIYENEGVKGTELLNRREEYAVLQSRINDQNICHVVEYQKGYEIYGWVNCYGTSYLEALKNKQLPLLSSVTKSMAYKIDTQNKTGEILDEGEDGILFSSENNIVYMKEDGRILCHYKNQKEIKEITRVTLYDEQPDICFKKDLIIWYDENAEANIVRY